MAGFAALALCDRAFALLSERGTVSEDDLLAHVYGGNAPLALRETLTAPLKKDERLERHHDGTWSVRSPDTNPGTGGFTALALAASGPTASRARIVRIAALHVEAQHTVAAFDVLLNPEVRVPRYVLARIGVESDVLQAQPLFEQIYDEFLSFLGERPVLAQEAQLAWEFIQSEARRLERSPPEPSLLDVNVLAASLIPGKKPTLGTLAAHLGISAVDFGRTDEEARVLAMIGGRLLATTDSKESNLEPVRSRGPLRRSATAAALPEEPGVYVMRDADQQPLYVGKAKRLRSRVQAYVHRPVGATRRLEGLVEAVKVVDTSRCETDLEALVLEDREIRRLQPRFNTVRLQHQPRYWITLPPQRYSRKGKPLSPPRLELSLGPPVDEAECVGPFRNETVADQVRVLARAVFELDGLRRTDPFAYAERLQQAWAFLKGDRLQAERLARRSTGLLRKVMACDPAALLLPADPRHARYAVIRPTLEGGIEGFRLDHGVLAAWTVLEDDDVTAFAADVLNRLEQRTTPEDANVVLRWFGAQRPPARLVHLPEDNLAAADAIEDSTYALLEARTAAGQDPLDAFV